MSEKSFNPRKIYWFAALVVLVIGIFILKASLILNLFGSKFILSMAHVGAISSGIFSLLSLGYYRLRNARTSSLINIVHLIVTIGLLLVVYYSIFQIDLLDASFPQLNATAEEVDAFHDGSVEWGEYSKLASNAFIAFLGVQVVFFVSLIFRKK